MDDREQMQWEKRKMRKKRRVRAQAAAYSVLVVMILALAVGIVFGVRFLVAYRQDAKQESQESQGGQDTQEPSDDPPSSEGNPDSPDAGQDEPPEGQASDVQEPDEPTAPELTPEQELDMLVDAAIEVMPLEDKVAGLFIVTPESITGVSTAVKAGDGTRQALEKYAVGGLVYFKKNIQSESQLKEMLENTASYAKYPVFLAVDEEGGSVARVASAGIGPKVDGAADIGATGNADNAYQAGVTIGGTLSGLGFNLDFAPVADLANVDKSVMKGRSYGADAETVSGFVASMVSGLKEQGIASCLKHFPGIGSSTEDTHKGTASTDRSAEQFWAEELAVFRAGIEAGADMVMVSHMAAPSLTGNDEPAIFSEILVTDILRERLGFKGVIITDAMDMAAISQYYGADEAAVMAILAGCDMLLMPEDFEKAYEGVLAAIRDGYISEERVNDSLRRIYRIKYADRLQQGEPLQ